MNVMKDEWQPLSEIWDTYQDSLDVAISEGFITDEEIAESYVWPFDLNIADEEQSDVKKYVHERMTEIVERIKNDHGLDPNLVASYIFRSVLCGMMWQSERIGK